MRSLSVRPQKSKAESSVKSPVPANGKGDHAGQIGSIPDQQWRFAMGRRTKRQETAMRNFKIKLDRTVKTALLDGTRPYDAQRILAIAQNRVSAIWRGVDRELHQEEQKL